MKKILLLIAFVFLAAQSSHADWYIFKHDTGKCVGTASLQPDIADMDTRGEYAVESANKVELGQAQVVNGVVIEAPKPAEDLKAEADARQEALEHQMFHERMEKIAYESLKADGFKFKMHTDADFAGK